MTWRNATTPLTDHVMSANRNNNVDHNDLEVGLYPFCSVEKKTPRFQDIEVDGGVKVHTVEEAAKVAMLIHC